MNVTERRQAILEALCVRRIEKVENLAFEFSVSRNTIKNDILELSLSYPIYTKTGRYYGGVYIAEDYFLGKQYLKPSQQALLEKVASMLVGDDLSTLQSIINQFGKQEKKTCLH